MIDSLLTLTKRGAFWLVLLFLVAAGLNRTLTAILGQDEPIFALLALAALAALIVSGIYTGIKLLVRRLRGEDKAQDRPPKA